VITTSASKLLRGRARECEALDELLDVVRSGQSRALVVQGQPGIGKTELLEYAVESASDFRVIRAYGFESEIELAFAALHQVCAPILDRLHKLPKPQHDALSTAFGLISGPAPDRFLVALAALGLLSEVAAEQSLLCVIDNAQSLDQASAQALAFAARRLDAESVAVLFATSTASSELDGLPVLHVEGLRDRDARDLLASAVAGPLDENVRDRIVAETRGNPLALLELPRGLSPAELAGGFGLPSAPALSRRIEDSFWRRFEALPSDTRRLSLLAAAESTGDPMLVWRAAERLRIAADAAAPAAAAGLVEFGARVRFRHPLVRSAVYRAASPQDRQSAHRALADAIDPDADPARRAWHRAHGASGPDDEVADELARSASQAQARGGLAAAAAFLEKSVELTVEPARAAERALAAAQAKYQAGAPEAALSLLRAADAAPLDDLQRARADLLRAQVAFAVNRGRDAPPLLLKAANRLGPLDAKLARETVVDAFAAALFAGRLAGGCGLQEVAQAQRATPRSPMAPRAPDYLLQGLGLLITEGHAAGVPALKRALTAFRREDVVSAPRLRWLWLACRVAMELWDEESWDELSARQERIARETGALSVLPTALRARIGVHLVTGRLEAATMLHDELEAVTKATGGEPLRYGSVVLAAWGGRSADLTAMVQASLKGVMRRGEGGGLTVIAWARALLYNAAGRYADALQAAEEASRHPEEFGLASWGLPELIEAGVRSGNAERAARALPRLSEAARASGTAWALGLEVRSRALLKQDADAEPLYREAIDHLGRTRVHAELARAHLVYGEWLRRRKRSKDARAQLATAHKMLAAMGFEAFAERAARELRASGGTVTASGPDTAGGLTAQEAQIARLARDGLSNAEIGGRLFISPRTVEYHLHKVFAKLNIGSRTELAHVLRRGAVAQGVEPDHPQ
jgi:DNA-binding CsgD family transcriptional regulator